MLQKNGHITFHMYISDGQILTAATKCPRVKTYSHFERHRLLRWQCNVTLQLSKYVIVLLSITLDYSVNS